MVVKRTVKKTAKRARKCPHLTTSTVGKWAQMTCHLPDGGRCPDPRCPANPTCVEAEEEDEE